MITPKQASQFVFTIVESLMAIVVVAILMTAISPIILSVAISIKLGGWNWLPLPPKLTLMVSGLGRLLPKHHNSTHSKSVFESVAAPDSTATSLANLYCVDLDNLDNDGLSLDDPDGCTATSPKDLHSSLSQRYPHFKRCQRWLPSAASLSANAFEDSGT